MKGRISDKVRLLHLQEAIKLIHKFTDKATFRKFHSNQMMQSACIKQLEIIGEACNRINASTRRLFVNVDWKAIVGMRNLLIHDILESTLKLYGI